MADNSTPGIQRGDYRSSPFTKGQFAVCRAFAGPVQYALITAHPLARFGIPPPPAGGTLDLLGYRLQRLPFWTAAMTGALSVKHIIWITCLCRERFSPQMAAFGILGDASFETMHSLVFAAAAANPLFSERHFFVGVAIFMSAVALELAAEVQRAAFKARPENKGKLCTTGFWAITRHINFTANVLYGVGIGLAAGGWIYTIPAAGTYLANFSLNAIPSMENYLKQKYGKQWTEYEKKVPWKLIPGVY